MAAEIRFPTGGKLARIVDKILGEPIVMRAVMAQWVRIYSAFIRKRFVIFSRGGGNWPPLLPATIRRRRKQSDVILRDTGLLFRHLHASFVITSNVFKQGARFEMIASYGGNAAYPDGRVTTTDVMSFHQTGAGHLPVRKILVPIDMETREKMAASGKRILVKSING